MITEDALFDLFERAVQDLDPAIQRIVTGAEQRGRRLRTRRRAWLALGGGFLAAVTATGLLAGVSLAHPRGGALAAAGRPGHHPGAGPAGSGQVSASPSPSSSPADKSTPRAGSIPRLARRYEMPVAQMLDALRRLLPADSTLGYVNPYSTQPGTVEVDYNDGKGAVDFQIYVAPTAMFSPLTCPTPLWQDEGPRPSGALPISCAMRTLPDGSVERDAVYYADAYGYYAYSVYVNRPDGITVDVQVGNGIIHTLPQVDRARPPGSLAEWEAVAENPVWHLKTGWHLTS
jgi:hypothetical protein